MEQNWIDDIEPEQLFKLSKEQQRQVIENGVDLILQQVILTSEITSKSRARILNEILYGIDLRIEYLTENEEYEACHYLNEIKWCIHSRLNKNEI
jgi:hypothetical protein